MKRDVFKVKNVVDGATIKVEPRWKWGNQIGDTINIRDQININSEYLIQRLNTILNEREVELKNPIKVEGEILYCYIFLDGVNIKTYFPELQTH
jgi:hypothetical protein